MANDPVRERLTHRHGRSAPGSGAVLTGNVGLRRGADGAVGLDRPLSPGIQRSDTRGARQPRHDGGVARLLVEVRR